MRHSPLDQLTNSQEGQLRDMVSEGRPWNGIIIYLQGEGVKTSESALRRWCDRHGLKKQRYFEPPEDLVAIDSGDEVARLRAQVSHLEGEIAAAGRTVAKLRTQKNMEVALGAAVETAVAAHYRTPTRTLSPFSGHRGNGQTAQGMLAHISDLHHGEFVNPDLAHGVSYSPEIGWKRMAYLRDKIIRYKDLRPYEVDELHCGVLGDMTSGNNHDDLDVSNALGMVDQAMDVADMLFSMAQDFVSEFPKVIFTVITGNHGRIHKVPRHKQRYENWDYVAGRALEQMVKKAGLPVEVVVPRSTRHIIDVKGYRVCLTHGDGVKASSFAGIPFYSLKSKRDALQSMMRTLDILPVDQISMGHFHIPIWWPGECSILMNGSIKGGDEYVQDTRYAHTPPVQLLQEIHPRHGVTSVNHIDLGHVA